MGRSAVKYTKHATLFRTLFSVKKRRSTLISFHTLGRSFWFYCCILHTNIRKNPYLNLTVHQFSKLSAASTRDGDDKTNFTSYSQRGHKITSCTENMSLNFSLNKQELNSTYIQLMQLHLDSTNTCSVLLNPINLNIQFLLAISLIIMEDWHVNIFTIIIS